VHRVEVVTSHARAAIFQERGARVKFVFTEVLRDGSWWVLPIVGALLARESLPEVAVFSRHVIVAIVCKFSLEAFSRLLYF